MTNNIVSDDEFFKWKSSWNSIDPIPDTIHQYVNRVLLKKLNDSFDELDNMIQTGMENDET